MSTAVAEWARAQAERVEEGLTAEELDRAESECRLRFPPGWRAVLAEFHPRGDGFPDWRLRDHSAREACAEPFDGVLFDVRVNGFWWPAWGTPSATAAEREHAALVALDSVPRLVPIRGHLYVTEDDDSPVFSIVQTDLWSPAASLADLAAGRRGGPGRPVPFWSELLAWSQSR